MEVIKQQWPWYIAGPLIGLAVPMLLILGNKSFGISSSFRHLCAICAPSNIPFFQYEWKKEIWNLYFVAGILLGGTISVHYLSNPSSISIHQDLINELGTYGISDFSSPIPKELISWKSLITIRGFFVMIGGGFLVGFGARYAGGCTSGHAIMGLSTLQWPSLIATICFMLGGVLMSNWILPLILKL